MGLVDYIIKEKIFNFFLYTGCVPLTEAHFLMSRMMTDPRMSWKKPVEVFGYNDAFHFFGSVFEAETNCISEHNMGQVASLGINNFSFFNQHASRMRLKAPRIWRATWGLWRRREKTLPRGDWSTTLTPPI